MFGVVGRLNDTADAIAAAAAAEAAGFELFGIGDNQSLWPDPYVMLSLAATATQHIRIGPLVTNIVRSH